MIIETMPVNGILVRQRLRVIDNHKVSELAASISLMGLKTPISVRVLPDYTDDDGKNWSGVPVLVAGLHRLEAVKSLRWEDIPSIVLEGDEIDAELWEIAENLHRSDLTVLERADHTARWVKLTEEKLGGATCATQLDSRGQRKTPQQMPSGINAAVRDLGIDRTQAQRAIKIADLPIPAKEAARQAGLDNNQKALLRLVKSSDPIEEVNNITEERKKHQSPTKKSPLSIIQNTWLNASQSERSEIVSWILKQTKQYA